MSMHICTRCSQRKNDREFYTNGSRGLRPECAHCNRTANRDRYHGEVRRKIQQRVLGDYHRKRAEQLDSTPGDETGSVAA